MGMRQPPTMAATVDRELVVRLRLAVLRLARRLRQETDTQISASQLSALASLVRLGPVTLGRLAAVERVRPPTMTRIVAQLEESGLVVRRPDPADGRVAWVEPSAGGRRLIERSRTRKDALLTQRLQALAPEELAGLDQAVNLLERLLDGGEAAP
jgi:DNA-binding MarR family transcriptional regulator